MRVFLLGAGFSKPCGLPLSHELLSLAIEGVGSEERKLRLRQIREECAQCSGLKAGDVGIELFLDHCDRSAELWRMYQHFETLGRNAGAVPWDKAIEIQTVSGRVDRNAKRIVADRSLTADLSPAKKLLGQLTPTDIVLTTNFDTVLERAAADARRSLSVGLPPVREGPVLRCQHDPDAIRLLKLHGSVDWYLATRRACQDPLPEDVALLYMKVDDNLDRHASDALSDEHEYDFCLTRCTTADAARALVGDFFPDHRAAMPRFGGTKQPHKLPGLGLLWAAAEGALREATQLICIGFSFSDQDQLIRLLLANSLRARTSPPSVMLVDPSSCDIARRIGHLLPDPKLVESPHQDVNWTSVLADSPV